MAAMCAVELDLAEYQRRVDEAQAADDAAEMRREFRRKQIFFDTKRGIDDEAIKALWDDYMIFHSDQITDVFLSLCKASLRANINDVIDAEIERFAAWAADKREPT